MNRLLAALSGLMAVFSFSAQPAAAQDVSIFQAFSQDPAIVDVDLSPNGKWLSVVRRNSIDGDPFLAVYDAKNLSTEWEQAYGASNMQVSRATWINDDYLIMTFTQQFDEGEDTYSVSKVASIRRGGTTFTELPKVRFDARRLGSGVADDLARFSGANIISTLPGDDEHIMVSYAADFTPSGGRFVPIFEIAKVNVETGNIVSSVSTNTRYSGYGVDSDGEVRTASYYDSSTGQQVIVARKKGENEWLEIGRSGQGTDVISQDFGILGFPDKNRPNEIFVRSNHDANTSGIFAYDLGSQEFTELLFRHPKYDASSYLTIRDPEDRDTLYLTGFTYDGKGGETYWIDPAEEAFAENLDAVLPNSNNDTVSASRDRSMRVIRANGPRIPSTYYLYDEDKGGLQLIGKSLPALEEDDLSDMEFVTYTARDGYGIPALVTVPSKGEAPFPTVVMPHGGPTARDYWGFDPWVQVLAYHGYAVIQPQYRISTGFGKKHLEDGFGEWGMLQQDDIDDAGTYMIEQGIADPDRLAIFGWSYGGYSSFVGAARDPNPYKCAIPGAGVADMAQFRAWLYRSSASRDPLAKYRDTVEGLNPLELASSVDVPVLVIHGTEDERVPISHSDKFVAALRREGKQHEYLKLEGANHFFGTIYYEHWMQMYPAIVDWLDNTCGLKE